MRIHMQKAFVRGDVTFIVTIPEGFTRKLLRGEKPQLLIQGDAIDPITTGNALSALVPIIPGIVLNWVIPSGLNMR
jgi:ABC-2 type transport system permease protein